MNPDFELGSGALLLCLNVNPDLSLGTLVLYLTTVEATGMK